MKDKKIIFSYICLIIFFIMIFLFPFFIKGVDLSFDNESVADLNAGWYCLDPEGTKTEVTLPVKLEAKAEEESAISIILPDAFTQAETLCIRSSLQTVRLTLDGSEIYKQDFQSSTAVKNPVASSWHLVRVPHDSAGKELTIYISSPYKQTSGIFNNIFYGSKSAVLFHVFKLYGPGLILTAFIFLLGLVMIIVPLAIRGINDRSLLYLGLFAMLVAIWFLAESKMLQFFTGNQFYLASSAYLSLILFPVPVLLYICDILNIHNKKYYYLFITLFLVQFIVCLILQLLDVCDFFATVRITHALILAAMIFISVSLYKEIKKYKNKEVIRFAWSISILLLFAVFEMINFYSNNYITTSFYLKIGLTIYILIIAMDSVARIRNMVYQGKEAEYFERMAYLDMLTGSKNRNAYDLDIRDYFSHPTMLKKLRLVLLDLNNLKLINDKYGHVAGDWALKSSYSCIQAAFSKLGVCYRIGGDEFACILPDCDDECYTRALGEFNALVQDINEETEYEFSIAIGSAVFDSEKDSGMQSFLARVDKIMYKNKWGR